jgi:hypothetical protein
MLLSEAVKGSWTLFSNLPQTTSRLDMLSLELVNGPILWDLIPLCLQEGGKRTLIIPPELAYGDRGAGGVIPSKVPHRFCITLLKSQG